MESSGIRVLVAVNVSVWDDFLSRNPNPYPVFVQHDDIRSIEQYEALPDKYSYDIVVVYFGGPLTVHVLND
jgi:hypothetical protein